MKIFQTHKILIIGVCLLLFGTPLSGFAQQRPRASDSPQARKITPVARDTVKVDIWFDKQCGAAYKQGEKIIINFRASADSYLTVYDIDTRGQVSVLFPNRHQPDNFVRGGQTYSVPDRSYSYDLVIEGPEGIEYVDAASSTDPYYHWNYNQGEPQWVRDWGLTSRGNAPLVTSNYKSSPEYKNRPRGLGSTGEESLARNFAISKQLQDDIRSKLVVSPRAITESPRDNKVSDYGTATCNFYVMASPAIPQAVPFPSREQYLLQQQREFQQIPGFDARQTGEHLIVTVPNTILFDFDSYALRYDARRDLDQVADILVRYPDTSITVAGHTDSIGDDMYNQRLSEDRAQSVANYLVSRRVPPFRISAVGYGKIMPIASNATEGGRQRNRRVELDIEVDQQYGQ